MAICRMLDPAPAHRSNCDREKLGALLLQCLGQRHCSHACLPGGAGRSHCGGRAVVEMSPFPGSKGLYAYCSTVLSGNGHVAFPGHVIKMPFGSV